MYEIMRRYGCAYTLAVSLVQCIWKLYPGYLPRPSSYVLGGLQLVEDCHRKWCQTMQTRSSQPRSWSKGPWMTPLSRSSSRIYDWHGHLIWRKHHGRVDFLSVSFSLPRDVWSAPLAMPSSPTMSCQQLLRKSNSFWTFVCSPMYLLKIWRNCSLHHIWSLDGDCWVFLESSARIQKIQITK